MGKKRRTILLAGLLAALLVAVAWQPLHLNEPWYHGKSLSGWLALYGAGPSGYKPSPKADAALRHIGPKAVPFLLSLLHSTNSHTSVKLVRVQATNYNIDEIIFTVRGPSAFTQISAGNTTNKTAKDRLLSWIDTHAPFHFQRTTIPPTWDHWHAYLGFQALGPLGRSAIPDLVALAHDPGGQSNPSGTGMAPNIEFWKNMSTVATMANQSSTYAFSYQQFQDPWSRNFIISGTGQYVILVDGEIAAWSLAAIGQESVPPLMELLTDPTPRLRCRAEVALGLIGAAAEPAVPTLVNMLRDPDTNTRWEAADALGCIARRPELAIPALTLDLTSSDFATKNIAIRSLGAFQEGASSDVPALLQLLSDIDWRIRQSAEVALSKISRDTTEKEVIPLVLSDIRDFSGYRRSEALGTLGQMTNEPELVVPALVQAMDDTNKNTQRFVMTLLRGFGPAAKAAVPKLVVLTSDPDSQTRDLATAALQKINSSP